MIRIGEPWRPGKPYRDRPGAYAIIAGGGVRQGRILCVFQGGELQLPGGGIDPGESPLQGLHREVMEETGWIIAEPRRIGAFQRFSYMPEYLYWARKVQAIYLARGVRDTGAELEADHYPVWLRPAEAAVRLSVEGDRVMTRYAMALGLV